MSSVMPRQPQEFVPQRHRISVEEFHKLGEAGILTEDDRVELIEGELIDMAPIGSPHRGTVDWIADLFRERMGRRVIVSVQNPLVLSPRSEPQPDLAILKPREDYYTGGHPTPDDVLLVIEVADTTLRYDREIKVPLYARHGIAEVWLVDLARRRLEVLREPTGGVYEVMLNPESGEMIFPNLLADLRVRVGSLFVP